MNRKVGSKIGLGFALALVILLAIGVVSFRAISELKQAAGWVNHAHVVRAKLADLLQAMTDAETGIRGYIITGDKSYLAPFTAGSTAVPQCIEDLRHLTSGDSNQQGRLDKLKVLTVQRLAILQKAFEVRKTTVSPVVAPPVAGGEGKLKMDAIRDVVGAMEDSESKLLQQRSAEAQHTASIATDTIIWGSLIALVVLGAVGFVITRNIARPLGEITVLAGRIAAGNLPANSVIRDRKDEVGDLSRAFERMIHSLRGMSHMAEKIAEGDLTTVVELRSDEDVLGKSFILMVANLRRLTGQMVEGIDILGLCAEQVSISTTQLASSAREAATAISQTTTTVEEVRQTAQLSNQKAKLVSAAAAETVKSAQSGNESTRAMVDGMGAIRQQMESIAGSLAHLSSQGRAVSQIVATVEELAVQSDLLAINAAIEAAKAGESGRGFTIVANEMRMLAEQSRQATEQVRTMMNDIQKAIVAVAAVTNQGTTLVEAGVVQSEQAGESIQTLAGGVAQAADIAAVIAVSSQQQRVGVRQVASAMESIKQGSLQNHQSARQLEAATQNLKLLGQNLKKTMEYYKV
jgi:methyl-accepting chemotaxis protein